MIVVEEVVVVEEYVYDVVEDVEVVKEVVNTEEYEYVETQTVPSVEATTATVAATATREG